MGAARVFEDAGQRGTAAAGPVGARRPRHLVAVSAPAAGGSAGGRGGASVGAGADLEVARAAGVAPRGVHAVERVEAGATVVDSPAVETTPAIGRPGALRISARGRRVILLLVAATIAVVLIFTGGGAANTSEQPLRVEVQQGQTLSEIAAEYRPDVDVRTGMTQIQLANRMNTDQVNAGQVLIIPAGPADSR